METTDALESWAASEVAFAVLNDVRNVVRVQSMLRDLARQSSPCVAAVFPDDAALEGAYDLLENGRVSIDALVTGFARATAARVAACARIFVPLDGSSLSLEDRSGGRGTGSLGARDEGGRGLKFFDALAVRDDGVPLGLLGLHVWARPLARPQRSHKQRPLEEKESHHWIQMREQVRALLEASAPNTDVCFLLDRDADNWAVLLDAVYAAGPRESTIVRAAHDRRAAEGHVDAVAPPYEHLRAVVDGQRCAARYWLPVPKGPRREARTARMEVRYAELTLDVLRVPGGGHVPAPLWAVHAREVSPVPAGEEPIDWMLLTTRPTRTPQEAVTRVREYAHRWRVEDFHKEVKGGDVGFEQTKQRTRGAIERWFVLHAVVAMRVLRITYLTRVAPQTAAEQVLEAAELQALRALRAQRGKRTPAHLTLALLLPILAECGGYTGGRRRSPGPKVIARALRYLATLAVGVRLAQQRFNQGFHLEK